MDQASASPAASCAHNPAAPRTLPSWQPFEDQAQTVGPPPAHSSPRSEPHSEPVHIVPRPSSPALCQSDAKGYLLPDFYSGCAIGISGRLTEGLLLWRSHRNMQRHRHQEFIRFLNAVEAQVPARKEIHAIVDNYATHKHPKVRQWLARHPRWTFHFTPTSASWLNAVEGFFAKLTKRRLKRGIFL